mgnify:CR=1 FL=1
MLYAQRDDQRIGPFDPNPAGAVCPVCKSRVIPKRGEVNIWHYAHAVDAECDSWSEGVGPWHLGWQEQFPEHMREVVIGNHRADIRAGNCILELQHSPITPHEIWERERFYGRGLIWLFDAQEAWEMERLEVFNRGDWDSFRWKHARRSIIHCQQPILLHIGEGWVLEVHTKYYDKPPMRGWVTWHSEVEVVQRVLERGRGGQWW